MTQTIRPATPEDARAIAAIYAPIVASTWISFEDVPPDEAEIARRISTIGARYPYLCCVRDDVVVGYGYASAHRERAAYRWSVDVSVYVDAVHRRKGVARSLYDRLLSLAAELGYYTAFAGIALPNDASVAFHRSLGFTDVGIYRNVGYKLGAWHDTLWLQRPLRTIDGPPKDPHQLTT